jgi:hypothetical protein
MYLLLFLQAIGVSSSKNQWDELSVNEKDLLANTKACAS